MKKNIPAAWLAALLMLPVCAALLGWSPAARADTKVRTSSFEYDAAGLLVKETVEPGSPNDCLQTSYGYDSYGNKASASTAACAGASGPAVASAAGARTASSSFGGDGRFPITSTNALGQSESKAYDARFGVLTRLTGPNGLATAWTYDGFGRKTRETRADGTSTAWAYKLCSEAGASCPGAIAGAAIAWVAIEQSYAANLAVSAPEKRQYYDSLNRVVRVQTQGFDGAGTAPSLVQDTEYNALGQVARQSNLYALSGGAPVWSSYSYDALGRTTSESHPDAAAGGGMAATTFAYNGLTTTVTNAKGQTKTTTKNAQGQVALVTDALGSTVSYRYDALGQLTQTSAAGSITSMGYNQRGQKISMTDPAMGEWAYSYNAFGELVSQRDSLNQTTTMAYDALGRMVRRVESDLSSQWSYDKKFDGTACGKGVGKLCEATADNGYRRTHSYDSLGRASSTATVLDNAAAPATVSQAFDANTGRVASKTWPTGYQAFYGYSARGYLTSVTGGGTNGFAQTVVYLVQTMNAQGQITQYRTGNQVTTVKAFDAATERLMGQTATKDGQGLGNVLSQSYSYDALGNLTGRADSTAGVGTQESFSYDRLNRLTTATILGGAVSPPTTTEVMYDARGNIAYKSDVGRYWYDPARPNRMTNVTLETAPGATQPLSGTRTLSYAFDDLKPGAKMVNGTQVGNGNLEYTVSHDPAHGVHTVRYESYTSFNMPRAITYGNFAADTASCLPGYTLSGGKCVQSAAGATAAATSYSCPAGTTLSGTSCIGSSSTAVVPTSYSCPAGATLSGTSCVTTSTTPAPFTYFCNASSLWTQLYTLDATHTYCQRPLTGLFSFPIGYVVAPGYSYANGDTVYASISSNREGSGAIWQQVGALAFKSYSCPAGQSLSGSSCLLTTTAAASAASCPAGAAVSGTRCVTPTTSAAAASYSCPAGMTLSGTNCTQSGTQSTATGAASSADRTLAFVYGPEHQRIKQNVVLSGNGTSSYFAGNTWYLNGEDGQGLGYEKEIRANGTTEHKHYVSAGGVVFALFTSRTGTLNGLTASSTSYFQHDQLGSIAVVANEAGAVVERLAYDPWGKRRFAASTPGLPDTLDAIVGQRTDRGYTMHEHLDEIGVIHMNGRIYDPLIGRFMSADPFIQAPGNLQSYNRYAYVMNNPLAYTDPSGYFSWRKVVGIASFGILGNSSLGRTIVTIGACIYGGPWGCAAATGLNSYVSGASIGQSIKAGLIAGLTAEAFTWAGTTGPAGVNPGSAIAANSLERYAAHAAVGCVSSVAGGGQCGSGAASAVFGKFATNATADWGVGIAQGTAAVVAGGVGSVIAGGKFQNGATTAAYGYLFNAAGSRQDGWDDNSGQAPNIRGQEAENLVRADLESRGYTFIDRQLKLVGGSYERTYDLLMQGPGGVYFAVESKSTLSGVFKENMRQVAMDVNLLTNGVNVMSSITGTVYHVRNLIYQGVDFSSNVGASLSSWRTATIIRQNGGDVSIQRIGPKQ